METGYLVSLVCDVLDYPRSSFYYKEPLDLGEQQLRAAVQRLAEEWPTYGYRRITAMLEREGQAVSSKQVRHHAANLGLAAAPAKRKGRTTNSRHSFGRYPNLVGDGTIDQANAGVRAASSGLRLRHGQAGREGDAGGS